MKITKGAVVELTYQLMDSKGQVVESADDDAPIRYKHGFAEILPGLEAALEGKTAGEAFAIELDPDDAYGSHDPEGIVSVPRSELPAEGFEKGDWITLRVEADEEDQGEVEEGDLDMRVVELRDDEVILDANHPLAGQRVTFQLKVISVGPPE